LRDLQSNLARAIAFIFCQNDSVTPGQARLGGLHAAGLLTDAELFALEDTIADWAEVRASMVGQVVTEVSLAPMKEESSRGPLCCV
jgi:hypothetical protein